MSSEPMSVLEAACAVFLREESKRVVPAASGPVPGWAIENFKAHNPSFPPLLSALRALGMTDEMMAAPAGSVVCAPVMYRDAIEAIADGDGDAQEIARQTIAARPGAGDRG